MADSMGCCIKYLLNRDIDHGYIDAKNNIVYIIMLANFKHLVDYSSGLYDFGQYPTGRQLFGKIITSDMQDYMNKVKEVYDEVINNPESVPEDHEYYLSLTDKLCLDWAADNIDMFTFNYD